MAKILLADDDRRISDLLKRIFQTQEVILVRTWTEELAELEKDKFDLVVTDIVMPGYKDVQQNGGVKEVLVKYNTPVIFISGYAEKELKDLPDTMRFLKKPFSVNLFRSYVRKLLLTDDIC